MLAQGGCASISHWLGSFRTLIGQFWNCRENFVIFSHWLGSFEILPNQCVMLAHNIISNIFSILQNKKLWKLWIRIIRIPVLLGTELWVSHSKRYLSSVASLQFTQPILDQKVQNMHCKISPSFFFHPSWLSNNGL